MYVICMREKSHEITTMLQTAQSSFSAMLVFNPTNLPGIYDCIINDVRPSIRNSDAAKALYLLARFACLACDHTWLEELVIGAVDAIEDAAFVRVLGFLYC